MAEAKMNAIKVTTMYAADMIPGGKKMMYSKAKPSKILEKAVAFKNGSFNWTKEENEYFFDHYMSDGMVGITTVGDDLKFGRFKREDFATKGPIGSNLIPILINDSTMQGIQQESNLMKIVRVVPMSSMIEKFPFWTERKRVEPKAKLAEFPDLAETIVDMTLEAKRYGLTAALDNDLIKSTSGRLLSETYDEIGGSLGMTQEVEILEALLTASTAGNAVTVAQDEAAQGLAEAKAKIGEAGLHPAAAAVSYRFEAELVNSLPLYTETALSIALRGESLPMYDGLTLAVSGVTPEKPNGIKWGWTNSGDVGAVVIDPMRAPAVGVYSEIENTEFDNVLKYATNPVGSLSFGIAMPPAKATKNNLAAVRVVLA